MEEALSPMTAASKVSWMSQESSQPFIHPFIHPWVPAHAHLSLSTHPLNHPVFPSSLPSFLALFPDKLLLPLHSIFILQSSLHSTHTQAFLHTQHPPPSSRSSFSSSLPPFSFHISSNVNFTDPNKISFFSSSPPRPLLQSFFSPFSCCVSTEHMSLFYPLLSFSSECEKRRNKTEEEKELTYMTDHSNSGLLIEILAATRKRDKRQSVTLFSLSA